MDKSIQMALISVLVGGTAGAANAKSTEPVVMGQGQFISTGNQIQQFSSNITLTDKDAGKALTLTVLNGPDNLPAFAWLRVFVGDQSNRAKAIPGQPTGRMILNENSFKKTNKVDLNAVGLLKTSGTTTLTFSGAGLKGAAIGWKLTSPVAGSMTVSTISPTVPRSGGTLAINGTGFAPNAADNAVYFNQTKLTVAQASPNALQVALPSKLSAGNYSLTVQANGSKSGPMNVTVLGAPEMTRTDWLGGPCGSTVIIYGKNFSDDPSEINVFFRDQRAKVQSASADSVSVTVPDFPELQGAPCFVSPTQLDITMSIGTCKSASHLSYTSAKVGWKE